LGIGSVTLVVTEIEVGVSREKIKGLIGLKSGLVWSGLVYEEIDAM